MLKVSRNFALLEEEGKIINLEEITYVNVYATTDKKYKLSISFKKNSGLDIVYKTLIEAEDQLNEIFKAIGAMK